MFRSIIRSYYKGAVAAILVYDITSEESFKSCESWLSEARENASQKISVNLVGNKLDLEAKRVVSYEEGKNFAL
jgi:Ras-related protein Rab-2A